MRLIQLLTAFLLSTALAPSAHAIQIFTDRAAFDAAVGASTAIAFNTPAIGSISPIHPQSLSYTFDGLVTTGFADNAALPGGPTPNAQENFCFCSMVTPLSLFSVNPVLAFGADIVPIDPHVSLRLGDQMIVVSQPQFLGLLVTEPAILGIGQTRGPFGPGITRFTIDNVALKTASVPEPAYSLLLPLIGLALIVARRRLA